MKDAGEETAKLLQTARQRGREAIGPSDLPQGLDHFTVYVGLLSSAIELAKLVQTEERDKLVIETHYEMEMKRIDNAFAEIEMAMQADFARDESIRTRTFEAVNKLIEAGKHEIALKFFERMVEGQSRGALDSLILLRNSAAEGTGTKLVRK